MLIGIFTAEQLCLSRPEWLGEAHFALASHPFEWYTYIRRSEPWGRLVALRQMIRHDGSIIGRRRGVEPGERCLLATSDAVMVQRLDYPHGPIFLY